jgi:hypothetical protein
LASRRAEQNCLKIDTHFMNTSSRRWTVLQQHFLVMTSAYWFRVSARLCCAVHIQGKPQTCLELTAVFGNDPNWKLQDLIFSELSVKTIHLISVSYEQFVVAPVVIKKCPLFILHVMRA